VQENIDKAKDMIIDICDIYNKDWKLSLVHKVPFYMTQYNLYQDAVTTPQLLRAQLETI